MPTTSPAGLRYAKANGHHGQHQCRVDTALRRAISRDGSVLLDVSRLDHASDRRGEEPTLSSGPAKVAACFMADTSKSKGLFFPGGHCKGVCPRRVPAAGRVRLEQPDLRPRVRECHRRRCDYRRRRTAPLQRRQPRRPLLGCPRRRPRVFRCRHVVSPQAVPASRRLWHQRLSLSFRAGR